MDGLASSWLAKRSTDASGGHDRLHADAETLGDLENQRLAWALPSKQQRLKAKHRLTYGNDLDATHSFVAE
jgi:hypothetical protein